VTALPLTSGAILVFLDKKLAHNIEICQSGFYTVLRDGDVNSWIYIALYTSIYSFLSLKRSDMARVYKGITVLPATHTRTILFLLIQYFILNSKLGYLANPLLHRPFPFLPDWLYGLSDHLTFLFCSAAGFVYMVCYTKPALSRFSNALTIIALSFINLFIRLPLLQIWPVCTRGSQFYLPPTHEPYFSYSFSISFWTQDLALRQILSSIDLFLSYLTDSTEYGLPDHLTFLFCSAARFVYMVC